jgi:DNA-binding HxlR family transcriptional regulator
MPLRSDWSSMSCPMARSLDVIGDPWVLLILRDALSGTCRFDEFRSRLGVADNVLSRRLGSMVDDGLLRKVPYRGRQRTHDEYHLTPAGADALPVLNALAIWGAKYTPAPSDDAQVGIVHTACGQTSESADVCTHCGARMTVGDTAWLRPWLAPEPVALHPAG